MIWLFLIPIALLLIGLADLPMGYYTLLRIVVFLASGLYAVWSYRLANKVNFGAVLFAVIAILFNPIIPVYMHDKEVWGVIDVVVAVVFGVYYFIIKDKLK